MIVVVTGATGSAGRAVCARLRARGDVVIAVGTDAARLSAVDATERHVADLTNPDATRTLAQSLTRAHGGVDAVLHLVGGWRAGNSAEADAWLRPRLVDALENTIAAFTDALTASAGRLAIVSSTAVEPGAVESGAVGPGATSSYARAKAEAERLVVRFGERLGESGGGATIFVIRALDGDGTPAFALAERLVAWLDAPAAPGDVARISLA